jgi:hypothetical protein
MPGTLRARHNGQDGARRPARGARKTPASGQTTLTPATGKGEGEGERHPVHGRDWTAKSRISQPARLCRLTLMPNSGRCLPGCLCTGLYAVNTSGIMPIQPCRLHRSRAGRCRIWRKPTTTGQRRPSGIARGEAPQMLTVASSRSADRSRVSVAMRKWSLCVARSRSPLVASQKSHLPLAVSAWSSGRTGLPPRHRPAGCREPSPTQRPGRCRND